MRERALHGALLLLQAGGSLAGAKRWMPARREGAILVAGAMNRRQRLFFVIWQTFFVLCKRYRPVVANVRLTDIP
jgi:hypothetical protein